MTRFPSLRWCTDGDLRQAFELERARGRPQFGFGLPADPWWLGDEQIVAIAELDASNAAEAVTAVSRGVDLVASLAGDSPAHSVIRDLHRLADEHTDDVVEEHPAAVLNDDQRQLLRLLAEGKSIPEAATELFLSVRTAERRLGAARRLLAVRTTAEAILLVGHTR